MSDYDSKAVENQAYCMPSMEKRNVDEMNSKMGYNNMSDRANTKKFPVGMQAAKSNTQLPPRMPKG